MSTRYKKVYLGIDNNVAPRADLATYGEAAVKSGKVSRRTLTRLKREEAAHANVIEDFVAASMYKPARYPNVSNNPNVRLVLIAIHAGLLNKTINKFGIWYTVS